MVLFEVHSACDKLAEWRYDLWDKCKIGCPDHDNDAQNAVLFGYLAAWFFGEYAERCTGQQRVRWRAFLLLSTRVINIALNGRLLHTFMSGFQALVSFSLE